MSNILRFSEPDTANHSEMPFLNGSSLKVLVGLVAFVGAMVASFPVNAQISYQRPSDSVGTGTDRWDYLIMEGESFDPATKTAPADAGFAAVYADAARTSFYENPILGTNSTASNKGALFTQTVFSQWGDKITYHVQFARTGTYYLYMRFTMFENGSATNSYLNEDSFFVPPDFGKDPQFDWPITNSPSGRTGGYCEGGLSGAGFLWIPQPHTGGTKDNHSGNDATDQSGYWEGNFHWNQCISSQFLNPADTGEPSVPFHYEVTPDKVGVPLDFTIGYREGGFTPDLFLFSTHTNLMDAYSQAELDELLVNKLTVQSPDDKVGSGPNGWSYLVLEGENYYSELNNTPDAGFIKVYGDGAVTNSLGNPVLGANTTASGNGALFARSPNFGLHADKVSYRVQFATPGTYYLYMRFTMFDNAGGNGNYLSEDSFFLPPNFDKDPQTDWPLTDPANGRNGGYTEGCCGSAGFLYIPEVGGGGVRVAHTTDTNEWEGIFHWNDLLSSQFLTSGLSGEPGVRYKYEVTPSMVGHPLNFTVSYREGGSAIDLFLFSTHSNLMEYYSQTNLDDLLLRKYKLTMQNPGDTVGTGTNAWSYLLLEGESYGAEANPNPGVGYTKVYGDGAVTNSLGNPVLGTNTTASGKGALFAQSPNFGLHADKVTYQVQFATPGTYYLYMRFTMFDNAGGNGNYLSEDSFFLPPDFDKDPQTDWPLTDPANGRNGGYCEGCCGSAGFLYIPEVGGGGVRIAHTTDTNEWEGVFHWNDLLSSQFLVSGLSGEPGVRYKYEVTPSQVGRLLNFTVSYREGGSAIDLFLFSTHTNLMEFYSQTDLDQIISGSRPRISVPTITGTKLQLSWPTPEAGFVLESTVTLSPPNWTLVTNSVTTAGGQSSVTVDIVGSGAYYRLTKP